MRFDFSGCQMMWKNRRQTRWARRIRERLYEILALYSGSFFRHGDRCPQIVRRPVGGELPLRVAFFWGNGGDF